MRANCTGRQGTRVNLGGGRGGGTEPSCEDGKSNNLNIKGQSLVILQPLLWDGLPPPNNEHARGSQRLVQNK